LRSAGERAAAFVFLWMQFRFALESAAMQEPRSFWEFWPVYVVAHSHRLTRAFHTAATLTGWSIFATAIALRKWWLIPIALAVPYALAWFSHFFVEHNRPATFVHPFWSWAADQKMVAMVLAGKMKKEVERCTAMAAQGERPR